MRIVAIVNQKGGCGKTTTAINLSAFLAEAGRRVLLIDLDPQGHATLGLQREAVPLSKTIGDVFMRVLTQERIGLRAVTLAIRENLDLIPADILLSAVPEQLAMVPGRETRLTEALAEVHRRYHYVLIDCPPNVGLLTFNALMACSEAIIPMDPSFFSLHGVGKLLETLDVLKRQTGHEIEPRALITKYTGRSQFVKEVTDNIRKHMSDRAFETVIRSSVKLAEAASHGIPISAYCQRCVGFEDYHSLAQEVIEQEEGRLEIDLQDTNLQEVSGMERSLLSGFRLPSSPIATKDGVVFTLAAPETSHVQLAGDFNEWTPDGCEMQFNDGLWWKTVSLVPGRYCYRYVIDGQWQTDPENSAVEHSPFGDYNSVICLDENRMIR